MRFQFLEQPVPYLPGQIQGCLNDLSEKGWEFIAIVPGVDISTGNAVNTALPVKGGVLLAAPKPDVKGCLLIFRQPVHEQKTHGKARPESVVNGV